MKKLSITEKDKIYRLEELNYLFSRSNFKTFCKFFEGTDATTIASAKADKTTDNIRSHARTNLQWLKYLNVSKKKTFSIRKWIADAKQNNWMFVSSSPDCLTTLSPMISAVFAVATNELMRLGEDSNRRVWFIIDEVSSLNRIPKLEESLKLLRKYGGCIVAGFQNIHQIYNIYNHDEAKSLLSQFNTKFFFREDQPETIKYIADTIGKAQVIEPSENIGYGADAR